MFEYKQDIGLLHGSLQSAANSNSENLFDCEDVENAVNIVNISVKNIIYLQASGIKDEREKIKKEIQINEKLHAAMFFTVLRSNGISSSAANTFYETLVHNWPNINWKLYVELIFKCDWSEYFIKCAVQMPVETLHRILKIILAISFSNQINYFKLHLLFQTLILRLIKVNNDDQEAYPFNYDFTTSSVLFTCDITHDKTSASVQLIDNDSVDSDSGVILLENILVDLCDALRIKAEETKEVDVMKIIIHGLKTILRCLIIKKEKYYENISLYLVIVFKLWKCCYLSGDNKKILEDALKMCPCTIVNHAYATTSWSISLNYLAFILRSYRLEFFSSESEYLPNPLPEESEGLLYEEVQDMPHENDFYHLHSSFLCETSSKFDVFKKMLCNIIQYSFEGQSFAVESLLNSKVLERNEVISTLEQNFQDINFLHHYKSIVYSVRNTKSQELRIRLLKIFYKLFNKQNIKMKSKVIGFICFGNPCDDLIFHCKVDPFSDFKLPDFEDWFSQFKRKTPNLKEIEDTLPAFLLQDPMKVLKYIIDLILIQGSEGKHFIQFLQQFWMVCVYLRGKTKTNLQVILNEYFEKDQLETYEAKNMLTLYKFLAEANSEKCAEILLPTYFFENCITPKLIPNNAKIHLILECSSILMPALLSDLAINRREETVKCLIVALGKMVAHCIETGNGSLKSLVIPLLKELEIYQLENDLIKDVGKVVDWSTFVGLNEMVYVYVKEFLPRNIEISSKPFVWAWSCKTKDSDFFKKKFSVETLTYPTLLNTLNQILPHLTIEEWLYTIQLVKMCCQNCNLRNEILNSSGNLFQFSEAESFTYAVLSCIITCLHFVLKSEISDLKYIISCFSNCLINLVNEEESSHTLFFLTVFLDISYLIECISPNLIPAFITILLELQKRILASCLMETNRNDCRKLISDAVMCLSDSSEKKILYQRLQ